MSQRVTEHPVFIFRTINVMLVAVVFAFSGCNSRSKEYSSYSTPEEALKDYSLRKCRRKKSLNLFVMCIYKLTQEYVKIRKLG